MAKRTDASKAKATEPSTGRVTRADVAAELSRDEAIESLPLSPPRVPTPPIVVIDVSPEGGVGVSLPEAVGAEPSQAAASASDIVYSPKGSTGAMPSSVDVAEAAEPRADSPDATPPAEGGGVDPSFHSILRCSRWAEEMLEEASVPELQGFLRQQKRTKFFREAAVAHLWALNSSIAMKGLWAQAEIAMDASAKEMSELTSRAERAEMALEDVRSSTVRALKVETDALRLRAEKAEEALEVAQRQAANELENAQVAEESQRLAEEKQKLAEEKQRLAEEELRVAESEVFTLKNRLHSATVEIGVAAERAENAEEIARHSDAQIMSLKAAITEADRRATEAEKQAKEAVEKFRKSAEYNKELAESASLAYDGGFQECKEKVQKLYGLEGIEELEPDDVSED